MDDKYVLDLAEIYIMIHPAAGYYKAFKVVTSDSKEARNIESLYILQGCNVENVRHILNKKGV